MAELVPERALVNPLTEAIREFVAREDEARKQAAAPRRPTNWDFAFLLLFAVDIAAMLWILDDIVQLQLVQLVIKATPALLGVWFVAYVETFRRTLLALARSGWFRALVLAGVLCLAVPLIVPYRLPLDFEEDAAIAIDGQRVFPDPLRDGVRKLWLSGLRTHSVIVTESYAGAAGGLPRSDTLIIGPSQMLHAARRAIPWGVGRARGYRINLGVTSQIAVAFPDWARLLHVRGAFPEPFVEAARKRQTVIELGPRDGQETYEIQFAIPRTSSTMVVQLPEGNYDFSYSRFGRCQSPAQGVDVLHAKSASANTMKLACTLPVDGN